MDRPISVSTIGYVSSIAFLKSKRRVAMRIGIRLRGESLSLDLQDVEEDSQIASLPDIQAGRTLGRHRLPCRDIKDRPGPVKFFP